MQYMTMICDLKNSKQLKNREMIQYKLIDAIKSVNAIYKASIASPFLITIGDEWQGLLKYPSDYSEIIDYFQKYMEDIAFYCGVGVGEVTIHNFELTVNQLDGPSFHKARNAIKIAKENNYSLVYVQ